MKSDDHLSGSVPVTPSVADQDCTLPPSQAANGNGTPPEPTKTQIPCADLIPSPPAGDRFEAAERAWMLRIARQTLCSVAAYGTPPVLAEQVLAPKLVQKRGCFVTLTVHGVLRGCMGSLLPQEPLYRAIINNARSAATRDPRFPPVRRDEVDDIRIEISVLSELQPLVFTSAEELLGKLQADLDGVVLRIGGAMATFLPQVWTQLPCKEDFLNQLARKAGCDAAAWRGEESSVSTYRVEAFEEPIQVLHRN